MGNAAVAVSLILGLLDRATAIGTLLQRAQTEGRDVTDEEIDQLVADDDRAREEGRAAREKARSGG